MGEELLETSTEGSVDMVVVRVVLVELKRTGVYFRIRTCRPCSQIHRLDGEVKKIEEAIQKIKEELFWEEIKISVSVILNYFLIEDFPGLQSWFELYIGCS